MPYAVIYALIGYLSGSVLYAEVFCGIFGRKNAIEQSRDANPGTANAFLYGKGLCPGLCLCSHDTDEFSRKQRTGTGAGSTGSGTHFPCLASF